jgi:hypothetical protein
VPDPLIVDAAWIAEAAGVAEIDTHPDYPDGYAIIYDLPRELAIFLIVIARHSDELAMELAQRMRFDAFGRSRVVWFPGVTVGSID